MNLEIEAEATISNTDTDETEETQTCPMCGSNSLAVSGHCATCYTCGYSLCSL